MANIRWQDLEIVCLAFLKYNQFESKSMANLHSLAVKCKVNNSGILYIMLYYNNKKQKKYKNDSKMVYSRGNC